MLNIILETCEIVPAPGDTTHNLNPHTMDDSEAPVLNPRSEQPDQMEVWCQTSTQEVVNQYSQTESDITVNPGKSSRITDLLTSLEHSNLHLATDTKKIIEEKLVKILELNDTWGHTESELILGQVFPENAPF